MRPPRRVRSRALRAFAAAAALLAGAAPAAAAGFEVELEAPAAPVSQVPLALLEVRGRAGAAGPVGHDVVLAIDLSDSTTASSGVDLDGDGPAGRTAGSLLDGLAAAGADPALLRHLAGLDLEESVLFAEITAAEALVERLDPRAFRVGVVAFSDRARVVAPLGTRPDALRRALASLRGDFWRDLRGTNFHAAIHAALAELAPAPASAPPGPGAGARTPAGVARERSILLLSDGIPTLPPHGPRPQRAAVEAAQEAALAGVRIYTFALGREAEAGLDVYRAVAATTGGRFERVERPADAIARLRRLDLANLASVEIVNETSGEAARAVRTFPNGSFDGFVRLAPGANRLRVTALARDGTRSTARREVTLGEPADGPGAAALRERQRALLAELRRRTAEVALWAEIERGRAFQLREVELGTDGSADTSSLGLGVETPR